MLRRTALLLAAVALPLAVAPAQETQPPAQPQATEPVPQPQAETPAPAQPAVEPAAPSSVLEAAPTEAAQPSAPARAERAPARAPRSAMRSAPPPAPVPVAAAPAATSPTPAPAPVAAAPAIPPPVAPGPVETLPATPTGAVDRFPVQQAQQRSGGSIWPWLLIGALLVGGLLLLVRRRRAHTEIYEEAYDAPAAAAAPSETIVPVAAAAPLAAAAEAPARPALELDMRPLRAGVAGPQARVEFELTVDNRGNAPAEDVRISTWMLAAGSSEAEQALIAPPAADVPPVTIDAGEARTLEAAVALSTSEVKGDAILPIVVAEAHYRVPDGSERHTRTSYAVGVPNGEELAHFDVEHPSGLHDGVVAQSLGEPERA